MMCSLAGQVVFIRGRSRGVVLLARSNTNDYKIRMSAGDFHLTGRADSHIGRHMRN
jgi:hypothetical protein